MVKIALFVCLTAFHFSFSKSEEYIAKEPKDATIDGQEEEGVHMFAQEEVIPKDGFGFLKLTKAYNKKEPPNDDTEVKVRMEPMFVSGINSRSGRMGMQLKLYLMWEDPRVEFPHDHLVNCTKKAFTFPPSILR
jgi:hypothetical protein